MLRGVAAIIASQGVRAATLGPAAARVAITDAYYSVADATYVAALKLASADKTLPFPSAEITAGSTAHISIKHAAIDASSPPLLIDVLSGNPASVKVYVSYDSVDGSAGSGTWYDESAYYPIFSPSSVTWGRGQRYFWRANTDHVAAGMTGATALGERWERVEITTGAAGSYPLVVPSSGEWYWLVGMSIIRNMTTGSGYRTSLISAKNAMSGSDPFIFNTSFSGANATTIKSNQIDVVAASAYHKKFIRGVYLNHWINEIANTGFRPFASLASDQITALQARLALCYSTIAATLPLCPIVSPMVGYGDYSTSGAYDPTFGVLHAIEDPKGNDRFIPAFDAVLRAASPSSYDPAYDWPWTDDYCWMCLYYATDLTDAIHPNATGTIKMRGSTTESGYIWPLYQVMAGRTVTAPNWAQKMITDIGASTTVARKTRALAIYDYLDGTAYPTTNATAIANRAALRATLDAIPAS